MGQASPTVRGTPLGRMLEDGYQSLITFSTQPTVALWEKTVGPGGYDGGEKIDVTTMHNQNRRTYASRSLYDKTDGQSTCGYDPNVEPAIRGLINVVQEITITYPNGDTEADWGYLQKFERNEMSEGEMPEATITIVFTGRDSSGVEQAPLLTPLAGSGT